MCARVTLVCTKKNLEAPPSCGRRGGLCSGFGVGVDVGARQVFAREEEERGELRRREREEEEEEVERSEFVEK